MPFKWTATPPGDQITVLFKGLLVLSALADGSCEIGVHRMTDDHFLIIEIRGRTTAPDRDFLVMRHAGPLSQDFTLKVDPPLNPNPGVLAFQKDNLRFDRSSPNNDLRDFRWKVDLHVPTTSIPKLLAEIYARGNAARFGKQWYVFHFGADGKTGRLISSPKRNRQKPLQARCSYWGRNSIG